MGADDRYSRQIRLGEVGEEGQQKLADSSVLVVGCGALGSMSANALARAGVGTIKIVDRDILELSNLQRQMLFEESHVGMAKAEVAAAALRRINSQIKVEYYTLDVTAQNVEDLVADVDVVIDGTDNFETRFLLNDVCLKHNIPWVYGGVVGTVGMIMTILSHNKGPCLQCFLPEPPAPGSLPTCDTQGVLGPAPMVIASLQATEALKLIVGHSRSPALIHLDLWTLSWNRFSVKKKDDCPACGQQRYDFLETRKTSWATSLCGRNAIQITPPTGKSISLKILADSLRHLGKVSRAGLLLNFEAGAHKLVIFPDGRAIVHGTTDASLARSLYSRYIGI